MLMVPALFVCGVAFGYFVALPRAVNFLQNFNDSSFDILIRATDYYRFSVILLALIGLTFQVPVGVLAVTRMGIISARQLARNRGYVILALAIVAAVATPTPDPVTMLVAMAPLVVLFELSVLLARSSSAAAPPRPTNTGTWTTTCPYPRTRMLFDLRGRGRRRAIQVIYLGLAVLMGGGLIFFGIGGNTNGGLFDAFNGSGGGGSSNAGAAFNKRLATLEKRAQANPQDAAALAGIAKLHFQLASTGENYDQTQQAFTTKGKNELRQAASHGIATWRPIRPSPTTRRRP